MVPGTYSVSLATRVNGILSPREGDQTFQVKPMTTGTLPSASATDLVAFTRQIAELGRQASAAEAMIEDTQTRLTSLDRTLVASTVADTAPREQLVSLGRRLDDLRVALYGNVQQGEMGEPVSPGVIGRIGNAQFGTIFSTYGPTPTHRRSVELAIEGLASAVFAPEQPASSRISRC